MITIDELNSIISELEDNFSTYSDCQKLADLYTIRNNLSSKQSSTKKELSDIIPALDLYLQAKRDYQLHKVDKDYIIDKFKYVCDEIKEFLDLLYQNTDSKAERDLLSQFYKK